MEITTELTQHRPADIVVLATVDLDAARDELELADDTDADQTLEAFRELGDLEHRDAPDTTLIKRGDQRS